MQKLWSKISRKSSNAAQTTHRNSDSHDSALLLEDDDTPETKQQVFEMFAKKRVDGRNSMHDRSQLRAAPSGRQLMRTSSVTGEEQMRVRTSDGDVKKKNKSAYHHLPKELSQHGSHTSDDGPSTSDISDDLKPDKILFRDSKLTEEQKALAKRRNSQFLKRASISMDAVKKVDIDEVYRVNKQLGTGRFGYMKLAEHKQSGQKIAIKFFPRPQTKQADFVREYNYSFFLSPHPTILDTYEGMYQTSDDSAFFFVQEMCSSHSLREAVERTPNGLGEENAKKVMLALLSAIEFMHNEGLVHRNVKAENILCFDKDFNKVKVTDFGLTRKVDTTVKHLEYINVYHAPELCETVVNEVLTVSKTIDIWAIGIIFYLCMRGRFPWQNATIMCKQYWEWEQWQKRKIPALPKKFLPFSESSLKLLKKTLCAKPKDRWLVKDIRKCIVKEKLLKPVKTDNTEYYYPPVAATSTRSARTQDEPRQGANTKRSAIHQWINSTLNTMAEISEQVVSAREL